MGWLSRFWNRSSVGAPTVAAEQRNDKIIAREMRGRGLTSRLDAWSNILTKLGTKSDKRTAGSFVCEPVTNIEAQQLWRGDDIAKRVIELRPRDALRRGYDIKLEAKDGKGKKVSEQVQSVLEGLSYNPKFTLAGQQQNAYGGSAIFPVINDGQDLHLPLDESRILLPKAFHVFEPRMLIPVDWTDDPMEENFGQVSVWRVSPIGPRVATAFVGTYIHYTRLIIFPGIRVGLAPLPDVQYGWGDSVLTPMRDVLRDYNLSWAAAVALLQDMAQGVFKMRGLARLVAEDKDDEIERRIMILDIMRSVIRSMVIDAEDDFTRTATPMTGMPDVLVQFCTRLAAAADMPATKLMGQSPAGMNATGESDISIYDDSVDAWGSHHTPQLERGVELVLLAKDGPTGGRIPDTWSIERRPLRQPTEKEKAELRKLVADTDDINIRNQIYTEDDAAKSHYGGDTFSAEVQIDWEAREAHKLAVQQASEQALAMQQQIEAKARGEQVGAPSSAGGSDAPPAKPEAAKPDPAAKPPDSSGGDGGTGTRTDRRGK